MGDNVVQLEVDLRKANAQIESGEAQIKKLEKALKSAEDRIKSFEKSGSVSFQKQSEALRKTASEAEKTTNKIRSMGGALNMIAGAGTGQIAQVAGAIGMLASPIGIVVGAVGALSAAWEEIAAAGERSIKITENEIKTQKELADAVSKTNEAKANKSSDILKEKQKATSMAGPNAVKYGEEFGRDKGFTTEDTYKIIYATSSFSKNKNKEQFRNLFDTIGKLQVMGLSPVDAANKLKSTPDAQFSAFYNPKLAARRVLSAEAGTNITPQQFEERYAENLKNPIFFSELQTDINKNKPGVKTTDTKLPPLLEKGKSIERSFPGVSRAYQERKALTDKARDAEEKFQQAQDAFLSADESEILPIAKTWYNWKLSGLSGMGGARAERDAAKEALDANISATKQTAPWITDEALTVFKEFVTELKILNQNMGGMVK